MSVLKHLFHIRVNEKCWHSIENRYTNSMDVAKLDHSSQYTVELSRDQYYLQLCLSSSWTPH